MREFTGQRVRALYEVTTGGDHQHVLCVALYRFQDGTEHPYIEISEPGRSDARVIALSDAVHALLNLGEMELFQVGGREAICRYCRAVIPRDCTCCATCADERGP